jgi:hypothetical protein
MFLLDRQHGRETVYIRRSRRTPVGILGFGDSAVGSRNVAADAPDNARPGPPQG